MRQIRRLLGVGIECQMSFVHNQLEVEILSRLFHNQFSLQPHGSEIVSCSSSIFKNLLVQRHLVLPSGSVLSLRSYFSLFLVL